METNTKKNVCLLSGELYQMHREAGVPSDVAKGLAMKQAWSLYKEEEDVLAEELKDMDLMVTKATKEMEEEERRVDAIHESSELPGRYVPTAENVIEWVWDDDYMVNDYTRDPGDAELMVQQMKGHADEGWVTYSAEERVTVDRGLVLSEEKLENWKLWESRKFDALRRERKYNMLLSWVHAVAEVQRKGWKQRLYLAVTKVWPEKLQLTKAQTWDLNRTAWSYIKGMSVLKFYQDKPWNEKEWSKKIAA